MCPIQFQTLMVFLDVYNGVFYSKDDKESPYISDDSEQEMYQTNVYLRVLLQVSSKHILFNLISSLNVSNSLRILYSVSLLTES
jgi:hypothetical protein